MAKANYKDGAYVSPWSWSEKSRDIRNFGNVPLGNPQRLRGTFDWDSLENVQGHIKDLGTIKKVSQNMNQYFQDNPDKDTSLTDDYTIVGGDVGNKPIRAYNPFYSQGIGPKNYKGKYESDRAADQLRWWEATENKFLLREQELKGIATAGGQEAYDAQQAHRSSLGKPLAEGARAAELLRQNRAPQSGGGVAPQGGGRQAGRAQAAEGRRLASNDRTTGSGSGGTAKRKLRAASLTRQPLGAGSQSAAQLLG